MPTAPDILTALGYSPTIHGYKQPKHSPRPKSGARKAKYSRSLQDIDQKRRELAREAKWVRDLKDKWDKDRHDAEEAHPAFRRFLDILHDERKCGMPKPGIVDWDVRFTVRELGLVTLPRNVKTMILQAFRKYERKIRRKHGWGPEDEPFPKGFGKGRDVYTTDWQRIRKELGVR